MSIEHDASGVCDLVESLLARAISLICTPPPLDVRMSSELLEIARTLELLSRPREASAETLEAEARRETKSPLSPLDRAVLARSRDPASARDRSGLGSFTTKYRPSLERLARAINLEALRELSAEAEPTRATGS